MTRRLRGLAVLIGVTLGAGIVAGFTVDPTPSRAERASKAFREARAFARSAASFRFASEARYEVSPQNRGFGGSTINIRIDADGEVEIPDHFRILEKGEEHAAETIVVGKQVFHREGSDATELLSHKWVDVAALLQQQNPPAATEMPNSAGALPALLRPSALPAIIRSLAHPRLVRRTGHITTFRAVVGLGRFHAEAQGVDAAEAEVSARDGGAIDVVAIRFRGSTVRGMMTYRTRRWQRPVSIAAPPATQIDPTPGIDEEGIAAYSDAPLLQPKAIPAGWVLDSAVVLAADETAEGCRQVELDYTDPADSENGYLDIYELPVSCAPPQPRDATAFTTGTASGWQREDNGELMVQIRVGATVVQAASDLRPADVAIILRQLVAFDLSRRPGSLPNVSTRRPSQ